MMQNSLAPVISYNKIKPKSIHSVNKAKKPETDIRSSHGISVMRQNTLSNINNTRKLN